MFDVNINIMGGIRRYSDLSNKGAKGASEETGT
jgi:hypothetical protein